MASALKRENKAEPGGPESTLGQTGGLPVRWGRLSLCAGRGRGGAFELALEEVGDGGHAAEAVLASTSGE